MRNVSEAIVGAPREEAHHARVVRREGQPESHRWPSDDFLILVDVDSIFPEPASPGSPRRMLETSRRASSPALQASIRSIKTRAVFGKFGLRHRARDAGL
jgi:hypothetical protein